MAKKYFIKEAIEHKGRLTRLAEREGCVNADGTLNEMCLADYFKGEHKMMGSFKRGSRLQGEEAAFNLYKKLKRFPHCGREGCKMRKRHMHVR